MNHITAVRYCPDCGFRILDKYQKKCAECREITRLHNLTIQEHKYRKTEKFLKTRKTESYKKYHREYMREYRRKLKNESD